MRIRILLAMQRDTQRDQSTGLAARITMTARHIGKVARYELADVGGDLAFLSRSLAEAVELQVLLRLVH
jgi:hypothetical protein